MQEQIEDWDNTEREERRHGGRGVWVQREEVLDEQVAAVLDPATLGSSPCSHTPETDFPHCSYPQHNKTVVNTPSAACLAPFPYDIVHLSPFESDWPLCSLSIIPYLSTLSTAGSVSYYRQLNLLPPLSIYQILPPPCSS